MSTSKLFLYGITVSMIIGILLTNALPSTAMVLESHVHVLKLFLSALLLYSGIICWLRIEHQWVFKIIMLPVILFLSFILGIVIDNMLVTPVFLYVTNYRYNNLHWFLPLSISLAVPIVFYIEQAFFKWVRKTNS